MMALSPKGKVLPWQSGDRPLMLAPMQGLTNRALRSLFIEWVRPDVVFTEFIRVSGGGVKQGSLSNADCTEIATEGDVPLVVQLVGHGVETLVSAAVAAQSAGATHINLNIGCPYGRTTSASTGGALLRRPEELANLLPALRLAIAGSFSVKVRAGYDDPHQIFSLLPVFEDAGVDFLVIHPRTVLQEYAGSADHAITAEVVRQTKIPVIANGDIRTAADAERIFQRTQAAGLMLGRGAIADPMLFQRIRGKAPLEPVVDEKRAMVRHYLSSLLPRYERLFCGDAQVLAKMRTVMELIDVPDGGRIIKKLRKVKSVRAFAADLDET